MMRGTAFRIGSSKCAEVRKNECGAILSQDAGKGALQPPFAAEGGLYSMQEAWDEFDWAAAPA
jgi:hypothetical protein